MYQQNIILSGSAITLKFYSKYESRVERECSDLVKKIKAVKDGVPKEKVNWPETTNQWFVLLTTSKD